MHLGVVTTSYPRSSGDPAGSFVQSLNHWLIAQGHTLEVIAAGEQHGDDGWHDSPVHRVRAASGLFYRGGAPEALTDRSSWKAAAIFSARLTLAVRKRLSACDGVVAHWLVPSALACLVGSVRKPLWAIAHGGDVHLLRRLRLTAHVARLLDQPQVHVNFVSRALRDAFADGAGPRAAALLSRASVNAMGIDLAHFRAMADARQTSNQPPHLVFVGRLVPIKGVDLLLRALDKIGCEFRVSIAGAGPEETRLRSLAHELGVQAKWLGEVSTRERDALLASADVVVVPSRAVDGRHEGMPMIALEALASGAQLVCTRSGGLAEIPESICFSVAAEDVAGLRSTLLDVLQGRRAPFPGGHWLEERAWDMAAPRILKGLR